MLLGSDLWCASLNLAMNIWAVGALSRPAAVADGSCIPPAFPPSSRLYPSSIPPPPFCRSSCTQPETLTRPGPMGPSGDLTKEQRVYPWSQPYGSTNLPFEAFFLADNQGLHFLNNGFHLSSG